MLAIRRRWRGWSAVGLALFIAGGGSNWIDRVVRGSVVDFMNLGIGPVRTGVFNIADMAIMLGAVVLVFAGLRETPDERSTMVKRNAGCPTAAAPVGGRGHVLLICDDRWRPPQVSRWR